MSYFKLAVLPVLVLVSLAAAAWYYRGSFMASYRVVDPDELFQLLPGSPKRPKNVPYDPKYFDQYGYLIAGETRQTLALTSNRERNPENPYDSDLQFDIVVSSTDLIASKFFDTERGRRNNFKKLPVQEVDASSIRSAQEAKIYRTSLEPGSSDYLAMVRYGNYVLLFQGRLAQGGYFESEDQFLDMVRALDAQIPSILERAS